MLKPVADAGTVQFLPQLGQVIPLVLAQPARDVQPAGWRAGCPLQEAERIHENVKPFLRTNSCEIANSDWSVTAFVLRPSVTGEIEPWVNHVAAFRRNAEITRHELRIVLAGRNESIDLAAVVADQLNRLRLERLRQCLEENVVALQRADNRDV